MEDKDKPVYDYSEMLGMFLIALTLPVWLPIIVLGLVLLSPLILVYVAIDDMQAQKEIEKENQK